MSGKPWSECSPHELLDLAQEALINQGPAVAAALVAAAQVQASLSLGWTMENRIGPVMSTAIWEGMRQR